MTCLIITDKQIIKTINNPADLVCANGSVKPAECMAMPDKLKIMAA